MTTSDRTPSRASAERPEMPPEWTKGAVMRYDADLRQMVFDPPAAASHPVGGEPSDQYIEREQESCGKCGLTRREHRIGYAASRCAFQERPSAPRSGTPDEIEPNAINALLLSRDKASQTLHFAADAQAMEIEQLVGALITVASDPSRDATYFNARKQASDALLTALRTALGRAREAERALEEIDIAGIYDLFRSPADAIEQMDRFIRETTEYQAIGERTFAASRGSTVPEPYIPEPEPPDPPMDDLLDRIANEAEDTGRVEVGPCDAQRLRGLAHRLRAVPEPTSGTDLITEERRRQIEREGWTPEHDDEHRNGEMAISAACYAVEGTDAEVTVHGEDAWQWGSCHDKRKKHDKLRRLAIAGALIAAEIDRELRAVSRSGNGTEEGK